MIEDKAGQLDKWNREIIRLQNLSYKQTTDKLSKFYSKAAKDMQKELKKYIDNYAELSFSQRLEAENAFKNSRRIEEILRDLEKKAHPEIERHIKDEVEKGYYGNFYTFEGNGAVSIDFQMLNENYIEQLTNKKVAGKNFSKRLYEGRTKLANTVTRELLNGAVRGDSYGVIAKNIAELSEASFKQARRLVRTEGGRAQSEAKQKAYKHAEDIGVKFEKMWLSTLDKKTRHSHQELDGARVGADDEFVYNGHKAQGPRLFGVASLDINCRCTTIAVIDGEEPDFRRDGITKEETSYQTYNEWAKRKGIKNIKKEPKKVEKEPKKVEKKPEKEIDLDSNGNERIVLPKQLTEQMENGHNLFYERQLEDAPEAIRSVWSKYQKDFKLISNTGTYDGGAYYMQDKGVNINTHVDTAGSFYSLKGNTFFHEFGHHLDYLADFNKDIYITDSYKKAGRNLGETVHEEINRVIKKMPAEFNSEKRSQLRKELMADYEADIPRMASVSDLFGGATGNSLNLGIGHKNAYWKPPTSKYLKWPVKPKEYKEGRLGREAFAEMFAASAMDKGELDMLRKWLPDSVEMFEEIINFLNKE